MEKRIMTNGFVSTALARSAITRSVTGTKINVSRRFIFFFFASFAWARKSAVPERVDCLFP